MIINEFQSRVDKYFQNIVGFPPRNFQKATILKILNRQDVLLRAPTGSGKTETAIAPFLFAQELQNYLPQGPNKLIYVVPLRTLANSLRQRAEALAKARINSSIGARVFSISGSFSRSRCSCQ